MADMRTILETKKRGGKLAPEEIACFVHGVYDGSVPDYQAAAFLMAVRLMGMDEEETAALTLEMARTGAQADLSAIPGVKVDKHSTGGVGDLTTLVAVPLCAACGVPVAKMSGRALGHTGGTLDKLAAIPGLRTDLSMEAFVRQVQRIGCAVIGQTGDLAPVDKALYALRDVTATVDSIPLIASSILSKKIAAGCDAILLDVKTGSGALITDMDEPLGRLIGNALEVREALGILRGEESGRARDLCLEVAARMVALGTGEAVAAARLRTKAALEEGRGFAKLCEMIAAQGGDVSALEETDRLPGARLRVPLRAQEDGYVSALAARDLGLASNALGAGRARKEDPIDYGVGIECCVRVGDRVRRGQTLLLLHANDEARVEPALELAAGAVRLAPEAPQPRPLLFGAVE